MPRWYRRCRCSGSSSRGRPTSGRGCSRCCIIINAVPVKNQVPSSDRRISVEVKGERVRVDKEYIPAAWLSTKVLMLATGTLAVFNFWRQFHATWSVEWKLSVVPGPFNSDRAVVDFDCVTVRISRDDLLAFDCISIVFEFNLSALSKATSNFECASFTGETGNEFWALFSKVTGL